MTDLQNWIQQHSNELHPILPIPPNAENAIRMDLSEHNEMLQKIDITNQEQLQQYIDDLLAKNNAKMAVGGYLEHRAVYRDKPLFNPPGTAKADERFIHLGVDVWMAAGTPLAAPLDSTVHSFADHSERGNYGGVIILRHEPQPGLIFHSLYGHLNRAAVQNLQKGQSIAKGETFAEIGPVAENGHWAPHLHFQLMLDMRGYKGDYPGVTSLNQLEIEKGNCPDANLLLQSDVLVTQDL